MPMAMDMLEDPLQQALLEEKKTHDQAKQLLADIEGEVESLKQVVRIPHTFVYVCFDICSTNE